MIKEKKYYIINSLTCRGLDVLSEAYKDQEIDLNKAIKCASRMTLPMTKSADFGPVKSFALYTGEFSFYNGIEKTEVPYSDGFYRINTNVIKRHAAENGIRISHLEGIGFQARMGCIKGEALTFSPKDIQFQIVSAAKKYKAPIVFIDYDEKYWQLLIDLQRGEEHTKNTIYVFGTKSLQAVEYFGDMTTCKALFDFSLEPHINVMEIPSELKGKTKTSSQMLAGIMSIEGAKEAILEIAKEDLDKIWDLQDEKTEDLMTLQSVKDIEFADNTLAALNIGYVLGDQKMASSLAKNLLESSIKKIQRYNFEIIGLYGKIVPDLGLDFNFQVLNWGEIFIGKTRKYDNQEVETVRYPKTAPGEHFSCKTVNLSEIFRRINKGVEDGELTKLQARFLKKFYAEIKNGNIIVPSGWRAFANLQGGLDYDGDAICVIIDPRLVKLYRKLKMAAIEFGDAPKSSEKTKFSIDTLDYAYYKGVTNANVDVGTAVNFAYTCLAVAQSLEYVTDNEFNDFVKKVVVEINSMPKFQKNEYGDTQVTGKFLEIKTFFNVNYTYKRMFAEASVITEEDVDKFLAAAYAAGAGSRQNMINILLDCNTAYSSVVGRTIDSTKNGALVHAALIWLRRFFKGGLIQNIVMKEANEENGAPIANWLQYTFKHIKTGFLSFTNDFGQTHNEYVSNDILVQVQNEMLDYMLSKASDFVEKSEAAQLVAATQLMDSTKNLHGTIESVKYVAIISTGINYGVPESMNKIKPYLVDMVRSMTRKLDYRTRLAVIKKASVLKDGTVSRFRGNFGVELVIDALDNKDVTVQEMVYSFKKDYTFFEGQPIYLTKGTNDDVYTKDKYDGLFFIHIKNGKPYIEQSLKDYAIQHDKSTHKYAFSIAAVNGETFDQLLTNVTACYKAVKNGEYKLKTTINKNGGGLLVAVNNEGKEFAVAKIITPVISQGINVMEKYSLGHEVSLDFIESYKSKNAKNEFIAIFGELLD